MWVPAGDLVSKIQQAVDFTSQISRHLQDNSIKENRRICQLFFRKIHIFPGFFPGNFSGRRKRGRRGGKRAPPPEEKFRFFSEIQGGKLVKKIRVWYNEKRRNRSFSIFFNRIPKKLTWFTQLFSTRGEIFPNDCVACFLSFLPRQIS